ncbi:MAG TPA: hypothetical protein VE617_13500 [Propionibacteriaceae bacterium]|nr:hypothetical protein [Propionibacteriaceae bacterium]
MPAAWALGLAASIKVASSRMTSTGRARPPGSVAGRVRSLPATWTAGSCPCRATIASHAVARAAAVARASRRPGSPSPPSRSASSPSARTIVLSDAPPPGPKSSSWEVIASTSDRHVAPAANAQVASTSARPRCRTGKNPARATTSARPAVRPTRSANNRGSTTPAAATVPAPPTSTSSPCDHASAGSPTSRRVLVAFT